MSEQRHWRKELVQYLVVYRLSGDLGCDATDHARNLTEKSLQLPVTRPKGGNPIILRGLGKGGRCAEKKVPNAIRTPWY